MSKLRIEKIERIIVKFLNNEASHDELAKLEFWLKNEQNVQVFNEFVKTNFLTRLSMDEFDLEEAKQIVKSKLRRNKRSAFLKNAYKYAAAAVIALAISLPVIWNASVDHIEENTPVVKQNNIAPGSDKAILTLENGKQIALEKGQSYESSAATSDGENLVYARNGGAKGNEIVYNNLTIPRGGQFYIELADGTKVWLNSESKLRYPVSFPPGKTRRVELLYGEAYFEVSKISNNTGFIVNTMTQDVEVLGTEFNIKAYKDEDVIYTTLVEGKVKVTNGASSKSLVPSFQSKVNVNSSKLSVSKVDVSYEIAWKNGLFMFMNESLGLIMKRLARWYNVEVTFIDDSKEDIVFSGFLDRHDRVDQLLAKFELSEAVQFEFKEKVIIIK